MAESRFDRRNHRHENIQTGGRKEEDPSPEKEGGEIKRIYMREERLFIRESSYEDCEKFAIWETDPYVSTFFTIDDNRDREEIIREFSERQRDDTKRQFTICLKETGEAIGRIYVSDINHHYDSLDVTRIYIAGRENRGKGYGEEALLLILRWAFEEMKAERVTLDHFEDNVIAASLYDKLGFAREGVMRHSGKKNGRYIDMCLRSMLREEYFEGQSRILGDI